MLKKLTYMGRLDGGDPHKEKNSMNSEYKMDKTSSQILSFEEADRQFNDTSDENWKERFKMYMYLNSIAYDYAGSALPVMDKSVFHCRKITDGEYLLP